ncbi:hypothetical protein FNV68_01965 [Streptomyces sp. S1D4-23]|nr:hypothetical protein FNV68_01965 [Streptomyces sp. S1D4-23]
MPAGSGGGGVGGGGGGGGGFWGVSVPGAGGGGGGGGVGGGGGGGGGAEHTACGLVGVGWWARCVRGWWWAGEGVGWSGRCGRCGRVGLWCVRRLRCLRRTGMPLPRCR